MKVFRQFLINPKKTGAIAPSSNNLAQLITDTADLSNKKCVVELGPGTGVFTKEILNKISPESIFFCLESNIEFVKATKKSCHDVIVYHDLAQNIKKYLLKHNIDKCDCIISSLPWAAFDKKLQKEILNAIYDSLENGGIFLTVIYLQGTFLPSGISFKNLLNEKFNSINKTKVIWKNIPSAFIYYCEK